MSHQKIIQDLIAWIDEHIDQPLNIDVVAKKIRLFKVVLTADVPHGDASDTW
ncbi:AraC family transcriptional regulator [Escherichia coli]|uniref:AraC family transcriptional regulator n=1 Tax=Escherichia coli TaxID=562 RepID=A0A2X1MLI1_ECOLX|nr:AraC family transcriptional regulator [Escherichia coli]STJ13988.1 AraC family transcriptional regulator [Escherichia coli]STM18866.1 AraC family transcriptional regulator [Escherichia coli]